MRQTLLVLSLAAGVLVGPALALATATAPAPEAGGVLLVVAPAAQARALVARAGGAEVAPVSAPFAILATSGDADFAARLRRAGAWLVLDGRAIARLCGVPT